MPAASTCAPSTLVSQNKSSSSPSSHTIRGGRGSDPVPLPGNRLSAENLFMKVDFVQRGGIYAWGGSSDWYQVGHFSRSICRASSKQRCSASSSADHWPNR